MSAEKQSLKGGCYCSAVRYEASSPPVMRAQCHCRACQHFSGGGPNHYALIPNDKFNYTADEPARFARSDLENPITREFCGKCGTHLVSRRPGLDFAIIKVGTLDHPDAAGEPTDAIYCDEKADFHVLPEGLPAFDTLPPRPGSKSKED